MGTVDAAIDAGAGWVSAVVIEDAGDGDTSEDGVTVDCRPHVPQNAPTARVPQTGQ